MGDPDIDTPTHRQEIAWGSPKNMPRPSPHSFSDIMSGKYEGGPMSTPPKADPELVEVFDTVQESEAMVVHGLLSSAGIESIVANLQAPQDVFPGVGGISVRVNPAQEEEARRLIDDYRSEERRVGKECRSRWSP